MSHSELNKKIKNIISESRINYNKTTLERMLPKLEEDLRNRTTSLGDHPIFPISDETHFEEKIVGKRFEEVVNRVKRNFDIEEINNQSIKRNMGGLVMDCMKIESKYKKELELLAETMIRKEYDVSKDDVDIIVELTQNINMEGCQKNKTPTNINEIEFETHDNISNANAEVYKRRFINSMIQGSAKKSSHMFHEVDSELSSLDPRLLNRYGKIMSAADYMYYIEDQMDNGVSGGIVKVKFPQNENEKPIIMVQAMIFPLLIHELVKGVMELLSSHGLPKDDQMKKYVIGKSDYLAAEPWDMRIGPGIWEQFTSNIQPTDFNLKHHVYSELVSLPVNEFNSTMREIMAGTKSGKQIINKILDEVKKDLSREEFDNSINERRKSFNEAFSSPDELDEIDLTEFGL